jgi:hypothetical protein
MDGEVGKGWWDPECFRCFRTLVEERPSAFDLLEVPGHLAPVHAVSGGSYEFEK